MNSSTVSCFAWSLTAAVYMKLAKVHHLVQGVCFLSSCIVHQDILLKFGCSWQNGRQWTPLKSALQTATKSEKNVPVHQARAPTKVVVNAAVLQLSAALLQLSIVRAAQHPESGPGTDAIPQSSLKTGVVAQLMQCPLMAPAARCSDSILSCNSGRNISCRR